MGFIGVNWRPWESFHAGKVWNILKKVEDLSVIDKDKDGYTTERVGRRGNHKNNPIDTGLGMRVISVWKLCRVDVNQWLGSWHQVEVVTRTRVKEY